MSISLADLKAAVRGGYAGNRFALLLSRLQSSAIDALAPDSFPAGMLTVANAQPAEESDGGNSITVRGQGVDAPFAGMAVAVRFFLAGATRSSILSPPAAPAGRSPTASRSSQAPSPQVSPGPTLHRRSSSSSLCPTRAFRRGCRSTARLI